MNFKGKLIEYKNFEVEPIEVINTLLNNLGWERDCSYSHYTKIDKDENEIESICFYSDTSYHGSACFEKTKIISNKEEDVKAFKALKYLQEYFKNNKLK